MNLSRLITALGIAAILATADTARADITIYAYKEGNDIIFTYSGSINSFGYPDDGDFNLGRVGAADGEITFGTGRPAQLLNQFAISGPENIGTGGIIVADQVSGDIFGFCWLCDRAITLPDGYVRNTPLSGSMRFQSASFGSLGIDDVSGPYVWDVTPSSEKITLIFSRPPDPNAAIKRRLTKTIKKLTKRQNTAKRRGKTALAKRLQMRIRNLKARRGRL